MARKVKFRFVLPIVVVLLLTSLFLLLNTNYSLSANFADSVLRPVIGNKATIFLESILFDLEDFKNKIEYKFVSPKSQYSDIFSSVNPKLAPIPLENNFPALPGEGVWQPINLTQFPSETAMATTFVRPDSQRSYAIATIVFVNMRKLRLGLVAGTKEPGGPAHPGPGVIPADVLVNNLLVAAFNGGFQQKDGQFGMIVGGQTYLPLKNGLATLIIDKNFNLKIVKYEGQDLGKWNIAIRQNGEILVETGEVIPSLADKQYGIWGRTTTRSMYTWRSGIGVTKDGNLLYAVGPSLVPETLAQALARAGAVSAMQLDINPYWVRFVIFNPVGPGKYQHASLQKNMYDGGEQFLRGYQKDFFFIYKR